MAGNDRSFVGDAGTAVAACCTDVAGTPAQPRECPPILHLDETCIVVDKPAGCPSVPGRGALADGSVAQQVQAVFPEALVVHRLDMATSGVLLFARGAHWQRHYSIEFAQRRIAKQYAALVEGRLGNAVGDFGVIDLPLSADWPNRPRQRIDQAAGKPSLTHWRSVAFDAAGLSTRLALTPVTGRSHQLRVHLLAIGHPIIGDALYGSGDSGPPQRRLMLHACSLAWWHPLRGCDIGVESPVPF
ncbi:RluA family pseudouridine synthase [Piscinibacter sakaiensis]|uniref:RluA family pseudouridine synthase n=1 Tax=Piscinibacter sakaiensis TaxID=1547922 RepID=UPI003AAAEED6